MASAEQIPPGGEGTIAVDLNTQGRAGALQKSITVLTDDPVNPEFKLTVNTQVEIAFSLSQPSLNFGQVKAGQPAIFYVSLIGTDRFKHQITAISSTHKIIDVELNQAGFENDLDKKLKITLRRDIPVGRAYDRVILDTDHPQVPKLSLAVTGEIIGDILAESNFISFGVFNPAVENARRIRLTASGQTTFKILKVKPPVEGLVAKVNTLTAGKQYEILLIAPPGFSAPVIRGELVIETDHQKQPEIKITVSGRPMAEPRPTKG